MVISAASAPWPMTSATTRVVLEGLSDYQHPKLQMDVPYQIRLSDDKAMSPKAVINRQIDRINALLGDRA